MYYSMDHEATRLIKAALNFIQSDRKTIERKRYILDRYSLLMDYPVHEFSKDVFSNLDRVMDDFRKCVHAWRLDV